LNVALAPLAASVLTSRRRWLGRLVSGIPVLFLVFDGSIKLAGIQPVVEAFERLGLPSRTAGGIGLLELVCLAVHLTPRTAAAGAVLLTGFLGGAVALHLRVGDPLASHVLFPVYVGALLWIGFFLRDRRVWDLLGTVS